VWPVSPCSLASEVAVRKEDNSSQQLRENVKSSVVTRNHKPYDDSPSDISYYRSYAQPESPFPFLLQKSPGMRNGENDLELIGAGSP
jgi:hypothetical protein